MVGEEIADIGITGVGLAQTGLVGKHAAHLLTDVGHGVRQENAVVVTFGHLAPVKTGTLGSRGQHGLRFGEEFSVKVVEAAGYLAGQLQVGELVFSHRHTVRPVHEDIRCHQDRIAEETRIAQILIADLLLLLLVGGVALQPGNRRYHGEQERQFGMFLDIGLAENDAFFRVKPGSHPVQHHLVDILTHTGGVSVIAGQGVPVCHKEVGFFAVLQSHPIFQDAEIMPQMQRPGRAHTRNRAEFLAHANILAERLPTNVR